ncbi:MAG: hypothetical protein U0Y68_02085 [Blastocatellia bacterium]
MRRLAAVLLLSTLCLAAVQAQPTPPSEAKPSVPPPAPKYPLEAWKPVVIKEANLSVILPLLPKEEITRFRTQPGVAEDHRVTVPTAEGNYQIAYTFLSDNIATPEMVRGRFDALLKSLKENPKLKWISGGEYAYEGNPGIEFKMQIADSNVVMWSRQFFAYGCIYEMTTRYLRQEPEMKEPKMFMDSFKLLGPPVRRPMNLASAQETLPDFTPLAQNTYYVTAETLRANALEKPEPAFNAKQKIYARTMTLLVTVSPEGKVLQVEPENDFQPYYEEVIKAAKKWTFKPFLLSGKPVKVQGQLVFKFDPATK